VSDWIKCSERMPEQHREVLILVPERVAMFVASYEEHTYSHSGHTVRHWTIPDNDFDADEVSHWMPLPEPPHVG
jgi:hypothetical protein